ncbi:MAG: Hsp20/alpha crystallin family protein [Candidatus Magasanikbacteria bacterium]|nr:Hsp20/alpha crystallin family protein [Candidatus Magasanikbacteria bacterium]
MDTNNTAPDDVFSLILANLERPDGAVVGAKRGSLPADADWQTERQEGQLAVDVAETAVEILVISTMAGALTEKLEIYIHNDLLTIRGGRTSPFQSLGVERYAHRECFWGAFSRTIVLPVDVQGDLARAEYRNGVLTIRIPKREITAHVPIVVVDE